MSPQMQRRTAQFYDIEILRSPAGLDSIKDAVLDSTKINTDNPSGSGRYVVQAGTVLGKISGSTKSMPISMGAFGSGGSGAWAAADIVGILAHNIEFWLGPGVTAGSATDEVVGVLHHGCEFNVSKLSGYTGNETIVKAALYTCLFS